MGQIQAGTDLALLGCWGRSGGTGAGGADPAWGRSRPPGLVGQIQPVSSVGSALCPAPTPSSLLPAEAARVHPGDPGRPPPGPHQAGGAALLGQVPEPGGPRADRQVPLGSDPPSLAAPLPDLPLQYTGCLPSNVLPGKCLCGVGMGAGIEGVGRDWGGCLIIPPRNETAHPPILDFYLPSSLTSIGPTICCLESLSVGWGI